MRLASNLALFLVSLLLSGAAFFILGETWVGYRFRHEIHECRWLPDPVLGFVNPPGATCHERTPEFDVFYQFDRNGFYESGSGTEKSAGIFALGDSHTMAVGVNQGRAWPAVLQARISRSLENPVRVVNMGVAGYSIGQEYLSLKKFMEEKQAPRTVVLGFSLATDAFDIRTPENGGFIYGEGHERQYFDLDGQGALILKTSNLYSETGKKQKKPRLSLWTFAVQSLQRTKLYVFFKRSSWAYWGASILRRFGIEVWPGMNGILLRNLPLADRESWKLIESILAQCNESLRRQNVQFLVVAIPYLPQVYDGVWERTFGGQPDRFDRFGGNRRLRHLCRQHGISYLDTTKTFLDLARKGQNFHFPHDGHPNLEGQNIIGSEIAAYLSRNR